jgi:putative oxidoreductase
MLDESTPLIIPQLGAIYRTLAPWAELLLRVTIGLALVPHGLRIAFGFFPNTGMPIHNLRMMADVFDQLGYRPGKLWAPLAGLTLLVGGPLLAVGLLTRPVAVPIVALLFLSVFERWRVGSGYFWNTQGLEYPLLWGVGALYFLIHGGGLLSLDHLLGSAF